MSDSQDSKGAGGLTARRAAEVVEAQLAQALPAGLYLVATPIGNLADITLRALATLARADVIYCEDTRHSRTLLAHYSISRPLRPYHEHNAERERPRILAELADGKSVALISDAGTPLVSDPGYKLVRDCLSESHDVTSLPGPSALLAAIGSSRVGNRHVPVRGVPAGQAGRTPRAPRGAAGRCRPRWCSSRPHRASLKVSPTWPPCSASGRRQWRAS